MKKVFPTALVIALIALAIAVVCLVIGIYEILYTQPLEFTDNKILLTHTGKVAICTFIGAIFALLFSFWTETYNLKNEVLSNQNETRNEFNKIASSFKTYPWLNNVLPYHFTLLDRLSSIYEEYKLNPVKEVLFEKYVFFWFTNFIDKDLETCNSDLTDHLLKLEREKNYDDFVIKIEVGDEDLFKQYMGLFWNSVKYNGLIKATSIVEPPPGGFWERRNEYIETQANLQKKKNAEIYRYFIIAKDHKNIFERHLDIIKDHWDKKIMTRVTVFKNQEKAGQLYDDIGIVDNDVVIKNTLDGNNVSKSTCYINGGTHDSKFQNVKAIFSELELHPNTVKSEKYKYNYNGYINHIRMTIDKIIAEPTEVINIQK